MKKSENVDTLNSPEESSTAEAGNNFLAKKEKSLGLLSTGFIKLFVVWKHTISLEQAAQKLSSQNPEENKIKTKVINSMGFFFSLSQLGFLEPSFFALKLTKKKSLC